MRTFLENYLGYHKQSVLVGLRTGNANGKGFKLTFHDLFKKIINKLRNK
jgi:hypothetical protein